MKFYNDNPNLTILLPVGCNAKCGFCFWNQKLSTISKERYLKQLRQTLINLPKEIGQLSISGGEPTMLEESFLKEIFAMMTKYASNIEKVVLNTNGFKLVELLSQGWFTDFIDHVNISRHSTDDEKNWNVFQTQTVPCEDMLKVMCDYANYSGIDVTLNCVYDEVIWNTVEDFVNLAKDIGASAVSFRRDSKFGLEKSDIHHKVEGMFKPIHDGTCIVCSATGFKIRGMDVIFKNGVDETYTKMDEGVVYEMIIHSDGLPYIDWEGTIKAPIINAMPNIKPRIPQSGRNRRGCGGGGKCS